MQLDELREYYKNPRKITVQQFEKLVSNLMELGDLSGIIVNVRTGEVIGGNQRVKFFQNNKEACEIQIVHRWDKPTPTGTVSIGYVVNAGERYAYREVDWDEKKSERANLIANRNAGTFDHDVLANQFDIELLHDVGFSKMELGMIETPELKVDTPPTPQEQQNSSGTLSMHLNFDEETYKFVNSAIANIKKDNNLETNEEAIQFALEGY